nr:ABC transporter ATP-binding protein [Bacillus sp. FJAT-47783]
MTKIYGQKKALHNATFQIEENKITGVIGRNGAGKTTLLNMIAGLTSETSGDIKVFSEKPFQSLTVSANTIFISDQMMLPPSMTLFHTLKAASLFYEHFNLELAERLLHYFSIDPNQYYEKLSKGMKSTFQAIIGIAARCPLTIFDEPTTGMDAGVRKDFYRALLKDYLAYPRTILLSSHYLNEVEDLLEDILIINDGQVLMHKSISEMKEWAVGLRGDSSFVDSWTKEKEVIHSQNIGAHEKYVVVKNDLTEDERYHLQVNEVHVRHVSPSDLSVYLTNNSKGDIDNVFR